MRTKTICSTAFKRTQMHRFSHQFEDSTALDFLINSNLNMKIFVYCVIKNEPPVTS